MKRTCPRKYKSRKSVHHDPYENGFCCFCFVDKSPLGGAPADIIKFCYKIDDEAVDLEWTMTPDECADLSFSFAHVTALWMTSSGLADVLRDGGRFKRLQRLCKK